MADAPSGMPHDVKGSATVRRIIDMITLIGLWHVLKLVTSLNFERNMKINYDRSVVAACFENHNEIYISTITQ